MLVLSRKVGERIHIGEDVFVEVRRVSGSRVTLAVSAPRSVRILRGELRDSSDAFEVLDDSVSSESAKDTVIIKHKQTMPNNPAATPHIFDSTETVENAPAK